MRKRLTLILDSELSEEEKSLFTEDIIESILYNLKEDSWQIGIESIIELGFKKKLSLEKRKMLTGKLIKGLLDKE